MRFSAIIFIFVKLLILFTDANKENAKATSIAEMMHLLEYETKLIDNLGAFANAMQQKVNTIQKALVTMRNRNEKSRSNTLEYFGNPLNCFKLIRSLHMDWFKWELFMLESVGTEHIKFLQEIRKELPGRNDLEEAVTALYRLQKTYDMDPVDMANGLLRGKQYDVKLSALDCYTIGNELLLSNSDNVYDSGIWLNASIQVCNESSISDFLGIDKLDIYLLHAETLAKQQRWSDMFAVLNVINDEYPNDAKYLKLVYKLQQMAALNITLVDVQPVNTKSSPFFRGCRGEYPPKRSSYLQCRYNTYINSFLKLAPLKMETLSKDPYIVLYHDVISDVEIHALKADAAPYLKRATIFNTTLNTNAASKYRTANVAWLQDDSSTITKRINQRIEDMTGFDLMSSEILQIATYGIGGHYDTHFDHFDTGSAKSQFKHDNRIATVLFYLSDVESGGATVFPNIELTVFPRKGTAVMWYNLDNSMNGNPLTLHGACPVLVGSKWVCNKWIRVRNQMFIKPCSKL